MQHDFHFISKKDPKVKKAYNDILNILKEVQDLVRKKFILPPSCRGSQQGLYWQG